MESSRASAAAALFSSGALFTMRTCVEARPPGLADLGPVASKAPGPPRLLALKGMGLLRGAEGGAPRTDLRASAGGAGPGAAAAARCMLLLLVTELKLLRLLFACSRLGLLQGQAHHVCERPRKRSYNDWVVAGTVLQV
jgi:hypothetical protein